jgi:hypothetical protein
MTQQTAMKRLAAVLPWTRFNWDGDDLNYRTDRAIKNNIDDVFDPHHISQASLVLLSTKFQFGGVFIRLFWLKEVAETWYGGVTDIFHDELVDLFSRILYPLVYQALIRFTHERGPGQVKPIYIIATLAF